MIKDSVELEYMKQSAANTDCGHPRALEVLRNRMGELEQAAEVGLP